MALAAIENLYHELGTGPEGLSNQEASLRLQKFGPNVLPIGHRDNLAERFFIQFKNMFNILLLVASFLSFASGIAYYDIGSIHMGLAILGVVILNAFFSLFQEVQGRKGSSGHKRPYSEEGKGLERRTGERGQCDGCSSW